MYCLGIDTSCYTTSLAAVNEALELCYEGRVILEVPEGARGLRQSDAFFQHSGNLDLLMEQCMKVISADSISCVAVSTKPRPAEASYMPVFLAGLHTAKTISSLLKLPIIEVTHQESHIQAGLWSCNQPLDADFMAYHVSGGTTGLLKVRENWYLEINEIGGSSDLNAGQFIDRIGVALGLKFPCGQKMDKLCIAYETRGIDIPISIDGCFMSFSGPETHVQRLIGKRKPDMHEIADISKGVFLCIARSIEKTVLNARKIYEFDKLLLVGGVVSNSIIKAYLMNSILFEKNAITPVFADPAYSPDNAAGTAVLGMKLAMAKEMNR